ncbi:MAG TPA: amino acid ABC transporter permease [Streptosporangiaceae bacterium]
MAASAEAGDVLAGLPVRRRVRVWAWAPHVVLVVLAAMGVSALVTNRRFEWGVVGRYLLSVDVVKGIGVTLGMTAAVMVLSMVLGTVVALMRLSGGRLLSWSAGLFVWVFRSVPMLVQLLFWYNLAALFPQLSLGVPWGPRLVTWDTNVLISPLMAAVIGLTLHESAFLAEVVRSGIGSVDRGQRDAAMALGLPPATAFRRIILPQAMRVIVPPLGNQLIQLLKATSLVSVIALNDLLYSVQLIYARNFETVPLLIVAVLWYLVITVVLTAGQRYVERHFGRGHATADTRTVPPRAANGGEA